MPVDSHRLAVRKPEARSRITNGSILPGVDGRSTWARRLKDLIALHTADLGGVEAISAAEASILRRAATLTVELERLELVFALAGEATPEQIDIYSRVSNTLRRHLESVGLKRVPRNVTPSVADYVDHINEADDE